MPRYDAVERHTARIAASPSATFAAIRSADLATGFVPRVLLLLRGAPAAVLAPRAGITELRRRWQRREGEAMRLADFERRGFTTIVERAPEELVIGLLGQFWTPTGGVCADVSAATFASGPPPGQALAGWNFTVTAQPDGGCVLATETRVLCADDTRRKFLLYWSVIQPGSGLIRRSMLNAIKAEAER